MKTVQIVSPREVALGGTSPMTVRRTLPRRERSLIGAWCFLDHYGPLAVGPDREGGMDVPPHPHTGLQTVSWLFAGEIEHRDSTGVVAPVHPGEVNLMTAGRGVSHSEVSSGSAGRLHGVQLWVALPEAARDLPEGVELSGRWFGPPGEDTWEDDTHVLFQPFAGAKGDLLRCDIATGACERAPRPDGMVWQ